MTNEEREIISRFIERAGGGQQAAAFGGSVPGSTPALPPVDPEANTLIKDMFNRYPEAPYRITQLAFIEEQALAQAQNRIKQLEWELQQARQQAQQAQQDAQSRPSRGLFGGLFGGGASQQPPPQQPYQQPPQQQYQAPPPPQPQYAPGYQPGMFQQGGGSGFLGGALKTAAGVAGGVLAADALMNLFSGHHGGGFGGGGFGGGGFGGETIIEQGPWGGSPAETGGGAAANPWDNVQNDAGWDNAGNAPGPADQSGWDNQANTPDQSADNSGWGDSGGGFDSGGGGGGFDDT